MVDSRLKRSGMTIERETCSIQQFAITANCGEVDTIVTIPVIPSDTTSLKALLKE
jgi:hypothetical protein